MTLEPGADSAGTQGQSPDPGSLPGPPSTPPPGPEQAVPIAPQWPSSGWVQQAPRRTRQPRAPLSPAGQVLRLAIWIVGLAGLTVVALGNTRIRSGDTSSAYAIGYTFGGVAFPLILGLGAVFLLDRVRSSSGHPRLSWAWALPVAAAVLALQFVGSTRGAGVIPTATNPPASAYARISPPYTLAEPTAEDAELVAKMQASVGQHGFTDAKTSRILDADRTLIGYLIVVSGTDLTGGLDQAMAGFMDSARQRSLSPTIATISGHSVAVFTSSGNWNASWFAGHFAVTLVAVDEESVRALAKAVLDAQGP